MRPDSDGTNHLTLQGSVATHLAKRPPNWQILRPTPQSFSFTDLCVATVVFPFPFAWTSESSEFSHSARTNTESTPSCQCLESITGYEHAMTDSGSRRPYTCDLGDMNSELPGATTLSPWDASPPTFMLASAINLIPDGATNFPLNPIFLYSLGAETTLIAAKIWRAPCLSTMANPARVSCA